MGFNVAIDGPAGAGKSTIARKLAKSLGWIYVDTGAMYRAAALCCIRRGIDINDKSLVEEAVAGADIDIVYNEDGQQVILDGENVNGFIRNEEVSAATSRITMADTIWAKPTDNSAK